MKKITDLLSRIGDLKKEIAELNTLKTKASEDLLLVANPGISVETARTKILDARLTIDLVTAKLGNAEPLLNKSANELQELLKLVATKWNATLEALRESVENQIVAVNTRFFNGDECAARRWWEGQFIQQPIFTKFRDAEYHMEALRKSLYWNEVQMAKHLMRHLQEHASVMGIKPDELI